MPTSDRTLRQRAAARSEPRIGGRRSEGAAVWQSVCSDFPAAQKKQILAVGQSHLAAWTKAARELVESNRFPPDIAISFIQLRNPAYIPNFVGEGDTRLNPVLQRNIEKYAATANFLFSIIGGNAHNVVGLVNHPRPYDFVLDVEPTMPTDRSKELIPCAIVRAALERRMEDAFALMTSIRALTKIPMIHCEPPPPIPSEAHIRAHAGKFTERIASDGISPALLRLKLWKLQSDIQRKFCNAHDIRFLPSPPQVADDNSMLAERAWGPDPTHGNQWYGEQMIAQVRAYVSG